MQAGNDYGADRGPSSPLYEKTLAVREGFRGRALKLDVLDIELPDGRRSVREVVRHSGAVGILARRPDGAFLLVRQYRKAIERAYLEICAGGLNGDEAPDVAAHRELREETGYLIRRLLPLGSIFACPGYSEEELHLFYAEVGDAPGATDFDPDENVETLLFSKSSLERSILDGTVSDAKTLCAWLFWKMRGPAEYGAQ